MPGGWGRNEGAREGDIRAQIFDGPSVSQGVQSCGWVAALLDQEVGSTPFQKVIDEFGHRRDARYQKLIARTGACHKEQVPFSVVDLFKVSIISHRFNAIRLGNDIVVAGHYHD